MKKNNRITKQPLGRRILRAVAPGIRVKLAFLTGVFIALILLAVTFFNYIHEGRILEEGFIRETKSSLSLINSVMTDMENVHDNILLVEDMRLRIEEKKRELKKYRSTVIRKDDSIANSFRSLGMKLGMKVNFGYHRERVDSYYSVYFSEEQIDGIEKMIISRLRNRDGGAIDMKEYRVLADKARSLSMIERKIDARQRIISDNENRISELKKSGSNRTGDLENEIKKGQAALYYLSKRRAYADRVFRNRLRSYFDNEFGRMRSAGADEENIRIVSSDKNGNTVYDTGSDIRNDRLKFGALLSNEMYLRNKGSFFAAASKDPSAGIRSEFSYSIKGRSFHVQYLPVYLNPATFSRIEIIRNEISRNPARWRDFIRNDKKLSSDITNITRDMRSRLAELRDKKVPPSDDRRYRELYDGYRSVISEKAKNFDSFNPYRQEAAEIADYYDKEIRRATTDLRDAEKSLSSVKESDTDGDDEESSKSDSLKIKIESLKDRITSLENDRRRSAEDISLSENLLIQDAFRNIRDAALYDFVVLRTGNQSDAFKYYCSSARSRAIEAARWKTIRDWIYRGRSETDIPAAIPGMKNVKTLENGIPSYSRSEAEEYMWKLDGTPLFSETGMFNVKADSGGLLADLLNENITGYNAVIIDKTDGLRAMAGNRKIMLFWSGAIVLLSMILTFFFAGFIVKRIHGIIMQTRLAAAGDLNTVFPEKGMDEIEEMAVSLNAMMKGLREREELKGEMSAAGEIQRQLLPDKIPENLEEKYSIGRFYRSMQGVGGDYYDFIALDGQRILFCIGDVSNHGVGPAMVMSMTRAHLHGIIRRGERDLERIVRELNRQLFSETPPQIFVTFFIGIIDGETNRIDYVSAGHMKPIVYRYKTGKTEMLPAGGLPLGMDDDDFFKDTISPASVQIRPGDVFFQYTDGTNEAMNDAREIFGTDRLLGEIERFAKKKPDIMIGKIAESIQDFTGKDLNLAGGMTELNDDIAMIVLKRLR